MSNRPLDDKWILYSPLAPHAPDDPGHGFTKLDLDTVSRVKSDLMDEAYLLPESEVEGWYFGLLQSFLPPAGVYGFLRSPTGKDVFLACSPGEPQIIETRLDTDNPCIILALNAPIDCRSNLVSELKDLFPKLRDEHLRIFD